MGVTNLIEQQIKDHDVVLYMKGTPQSPMCGFSANVVQVLTLLKVPFHSIDVMENMTIRQLVKEYSNWPTIPQLYVNSEFIGGCDIVREMYNTGDLQKLFCQKKSFN